MLRRLASLPARPHIHARFLSTKVNFTGLILLITNKFCSPKGKKDACLWIRSSLFNLADTSTVYKQLNKLNCRSDFLPSIRSYIGSFREETLLHSIRHCLSSVKEQDFNVVSLNPHPKDGGVFVHFKYDSPDPDNALHKIREAVENQLKCQGITSWWGKQLHKVWIVRGHPWPEVRIWTHNFSSHNSTA